MKASHLFSSRLRTKVAAGLFILSFLISPVFLASDAKAQSAETRPRSTVEGSKQEVARQQSNVNGHVVFEDTGQPMPKALVRLLNPRSPSYRVTMTNERGEFTFSNVSAGEYYVMAINTEEGLANEVAFRIPLPTGDAANDKERLERWSKNATKIVVDGTNSNAIEIRVPRYRGGIVSGRVAYANGTSAANARVSFWSRSPNGKEDLEHVMANFSVQSNEQGIYRISGVRPGEYTVSADPPPKEEKGERAQVSITQSLVPTYYPSATDAGSAVPVNVFLGQEIAGINITLIELNAHRISGTAKMRGSGEPVAYVMVRLSPRDGGNHSTALRGGDAQSTNASAIQIDPETIPQFQPTDQEGRWSFSNVPDGVYVISIEARQLVPPRNDSAGPPTLGRSSRAEAPKFAAKRQEVTVAGADLKDMAIELSAGGRISGSVVIEGDKPLPPRMSIAAGTQGGAQPPSLATVEADGTFTMNGVPEGEVFLNPLLRPPNMFYLKAIEANGVDLLRERLRIDEGTEIKNVRVVISSNVGVLTGHVLASRGRTPLSKVLVFLVPIDPDKRHLPSARFTAMTNLDGVFLIGAAPGDYFAIAWRPGEGPPPLDDEALAQSALRITLRAGERRSMDFVK